MMNILMVYHIYPNLYGGVSNVVYQEANLLSLKDLKISILTTNAFYDYKNHANDCIVKVYRHKLLLKKISHVTKIYIPVINSFFDVKRILKRFDCIHLHSYRNIQCLIVYYWAQKYNIPYILQVHNSLDESKQNILKTIYDAIFGRKILRDASRVIALSKKEYRQYIDHGVPKNKIEIVPNGINVSNYLEDLDGNYYVNKYGVSGDKNVILYLGRIQKDKGLDFLIRSFAHLISELNYESVILVIAGPDEGYLNQLKALTGNLRVDDKILFVGPVSEKEKILNYTNCDVVVNVEPENVFGLVPLEAATCYKPVIVSTGNALSEEINSEYFGYSVVYGDVVALATQLGDLIINDSLMKELGENGHKYVVKKYNWNTILVKLIEIYKEVYCEKRGT